MRKRGKTGQQGGTAVNQGTVVRRLHASFSGSPWVGNELDGELAQLVPQAGLTSAQTNAVIPAGTPISSRSRSMKAEYPPAHHRPLIDHLS